MSNTVISPNMSMPVPVVGVDPGPDWATNLDACLSILDGHSHTSGSGVGIVSNAININADLPFNSNNAVTLRTVRFSPQGAPVAGVSDLGCLYEQGVDLYYIDGSGNQIRITQGGSVVGSSGTITGLPSGTASASFAASAFTFQSATNTPAAMNFGPITIGQATNTSKGVTVSCSGSQPANYSLTLPLALPANQSVISSDSSGNLSFIPNSNWTTYSPTINSGLTLSGGSLAKWRRVSQNMEIYVDLTFSVVSSPVGALAISLPPGFTISATNYPNGTNVAFGSGYYVRTLRNDFMAIIQWDGVSSPSSLVLSTGYGATSTDGFGVTILNANQLRVNDSVGFSCSFICDQFV